MKQETFTDIEYSFRKKKTKREEFLEIMDEIIPWDEWVGVIAPCYPKGKGGRPPMGIEKMLRMYLLQIWFRQHRAISSAALSGHFAPEIRCDFLKYTKYFCKITPFSDAKCTHKSLLPNCAVLPLICPTRRPKMPFTTAMPCGNSQALAS